MIARHINHAAVLAQNLLETEEDGWIGVDLDGTLAKHNGYKSATHIGDPVPAMAARVRRWVGRGQKVKIFTARADDEKSVNVIKKWLKKHNLPDLEVTNLKDKNMLELWDDRAIQVKKNTGKRVESEDPKNFLQQHAPAWKTNKFQTSDGYILTRCAEGWLGPMSDIWDDLNGHPVDTFGEELEGDFIR